MRVSNKIADRTPLENMSHLKGDTGLQSGTSNSDIWLNGIISLCRKEDPDRYVLRIAIKKYTEATFLDF